MPTFSRNRQALNGIPQNPVQLMSNTFYASRPCESKTGWTDDSTGTGTVTELPSPDDWPAFYLSSGGSTGGVGYLHRDDGTFSTTGTYSFTIWPQGLGTLGDVDYFEIAIGPGFNFAFTNTTIYATKTSAAYEDTGQTVETGVWTRWTIQETNVSNISLWKNNDLVYSTKSTTTGVANGEIILKQNGGTNINRATWIRSIRAGNGIIYP